MERTIVSGIVKKVEVIGRNLSFVTVLPISNEGYVETRIPVYMTLDQGFVGKLTDIVTTRKGLFGKRFKQTIETADRSNSTEMPYSMVKNINNSYRGREHLEVA